MTLYTFDSDDVGQSNCYADCAQSWKPFLVSKGDKKRWGYSKVARTDGTEQWAYKGQPLYTWIADNKPGDQTGDGVGGVWHVATKGKKRSQGYANSYSGNYDNNDKNY